MRGQQTIGGRHRKNHTVRGTTEKPCRADYAVNKLSARGVAFPNLRRHHHIYKYIYISIRWVCQMPDNGLYIPASFHLRHSTARCNLYRKVDSLARLNRSLAKNEREHIGKLATGIGHYWRRIGWRDFRISVGRHGTLLLTAPSPAGLSFERGSRAVNSSTFRACYIAGRGCRFLLVVLYCHQFSFKNEKKKIVSAYPRADWAQVLEREARGVLEIESTGSPHSDILSLGFLYVQPRKLV